MSQLAKNLVSGSDVSHSDSTWVCCTDHSLHIELDSTPPHPSLRRFWSSQPLRHHRDPTAEDKVRRLPLAGVVASSMIWASAASVCARSQIIRLSS